MPNNSLLTETIAATARLNRYHHQVVDRLAGIAPNDPATADVRAKVLALRDTLNRARIAMAAVPVNRLSLDALTAVERIDLERMGQDLDRMAEWANTTRLQVDAWLKGKGRVDARRSEIVALATRQNTARVAVLAAREAARAYAPADYRLDEILF